MAKLSEQDFKKSLSSGSFSRVYLIYGEEKLLVRHYTEKLCEKVSGKTPSEFDFVRLPSGVEVQEIIDACDQFPLMSKYKCVVVTDYRFENLSDSDFKRISAFCEDIAPSAVLVFTMPTLAAEDKKNGKKGSKLQKMVTVIEKQGTVIELQRRGDIALEKQLISWAEKSDCQLSQHNAAKIIARCGTDMTTLKNEMAKLCAYANKSTITEEMVKQLATENTEVRIFDLSDCIASNNYNGAYKHLYALFEQNEKPEVILSTLSSVFIDMYRAKVAAESGKTNAELAADFKYGRREFVLRGASARASRYNIEAIRNILDIILETDIQIKSKPSDRRILLETLLARLMAASGGR